MKRWMKVCFALVLVIGALVGLVVAKNQPPQLADPDYFGYYLEQARFDVGDKSVMLTSGG